MTKFDMGAIASRKTPFYYYDMALLQATIDEIKSLTAGHPVHVHYAVKANGNPDILKVFAKSGFGADCVSGGEVEAAIAAGIKPEDIGYAGVGKTDDELRLGIDKEIGYFNVESIEELVRIEELASEMGKKARVALRVNPGIDAHTHEYITTGLAENKFGIDMSRLDEAVDIAVNSGSLELVGLHSHIGSQITITEPFALLCRKFNDIVERFRAKGVEFKVLNIGGGLGVDYEDPDANPIPDFKGYFDTVFANIKLAPGQELHCEFGRSLVAQFGSLIGQVIYVKQGPNKKFAIIDAGMNDLLRPALYGAHHRIDVLGEDGLPLPLDGETEVYDVVGPICESSDTFAKDEKLPVLKRGAYVALRSAGAYGESMASAYNMRCRNESLLNF